jgi:glycosyltransferase involved in cell wall biosynthesis
VKIALARGAGDYGGINRRFRALAEYCAGRHEAIGLMLLGEVDGVVNGPIPTYGFSRKGMTWDIMRAVAIDEVLAAAEPLIARVADVLTAERPDRVLAVDTDLKGLTVIAACRRAGLPVTTFVASLSHIEAQYDARPAQRYMPAVERYCLTRSDRLIFPSRYAADCCQAAHGAMAPWTVIYNGIAAEFLDAPRPEPDARKIGAVMRLSRIKNPETLGRIATAVRQRGYSLSLITDLRTPAQRRQQALVRDASILPPTLCTATLAAFYQHCRAVVTPSHFEASGNVPMEAIAAGSPAVITSRVGVAEVFRDLGLGDLIVEVDDVEGTVERLVAARPIEDTVRDRLRGEFRWPAVCERIVNAL